MSWPSVRAVVVATWIGVLSSSPLLGQTELFLRGNELYQQGDFIGAAESYERVLEGGFQSAALYYNLGNARFRAGEPHLAVLNYERAARLDPGRTDVAENLRLARLQLADRIEPLPRFFLLGVVDWWMRLIPRTLLIVLSAASYVAAGAGVASMLLQRPRGWARFIRRLTYAFGFVALILGGTLFLRETRLGAPIEAIVMAPEVSVMSAPSNDGGLTLFSLHAGAKVRIDQQAGQWAEVVLQDGKVGWLTLDVLEVI